MSQKDLIQSSKVLDTRALINASSDEAAGTMLLAAFAKAFDEVNKGFDPDKHEKGTATIPTVTILVQSTVDRKKGKPKSKRKSAAVPYVIFDEATSHVSEPYPGDDGHGYWGK